jgi:REJ domain
MKKIFFPLLSTVFAILVFVTCKKTEETPSTLPPVAKAGTDAAIYPPIDSVTLDGSASIDPDSKTLYYQWTKISGPDTFSIINASAVRTTVKNLKWGTYKFQLQVTGSNNLAAKDTVQIRVVGPSPIAKAGADTTIKLSSCADISGTVDLDGTGSSDPNNDIVSTCWSQISGPTGVFVISPCSSKTKVVRISPGDYAFLLEVSDASGSVSRDTMLIHAAGGLKEYDFDITLNSIYNFTDNFHDTYYGDNYYDLITAGGTVNFPAFGDLGIYLSETTDTANSGDVHYTTINIDDGKGNNANGECSVNFKKLIGQGGGTFNGTYKVTTGSAQACGGDPISHLAPLTVTGNLDPATHKITLRIKGKLYF